MNRLFDDSNGWMCLAGSLSPEDAARHAWDFDASDLVQLGYEALLAVARIRPLRIRLATLRMMRRSEGRGAQ